MKNELKRLVYKLEEKGFIDIYNESFEAAETVESFICLLKHDGRFPFTIVFDFIDEDGIIKVKDEIITKLLIEDIFENYHNSKRYIDNEGIVDDYLQKLEGKDHDWLQIMQYLVYYSKEHETLESLIRHVDRILNNNVMIFSYSVRDVANSLVDMGILQKFINLELYNY